MSQDTSIIIFGGSGPVGRYFMQRLAAFGLKAQVVSRRPLDLLPDGFTQIELDLTGTTNWAPPKDSIIVSFLPLWLLAASLTRFHGAQALIATGSTSIFGKAKSNDAHEREVAQKLEQAEKALIDWSEQHNVTWTILRPTLIYDGTTDKNIMQMARFIRRWKFFPIATPGKGLRQPIHADDVAKAAIKCVGNPKAFNKTFNIAGREILPYRVMTQRVFTALGMKPRLITLPCWMWQIAFKIGVKFGFIQNRDFGAAVFKRMNEDLVFPVTEGFKTLDYQPRPFKPEFAPLL